MYFQEILEIFSVLRGLIIQSKNIVKRLIGFMILVANFEIRILNKTSCYLEESYIHCK